MLSKPEEDNISLDDINSFGNKASIIEMFESIKAYNRMLAEKITFINPTLTKVIPFSRENLYLVCAYTGSGKSSCAANISYPLWQQGKKTLIIANEESKNDVLMRIACLHKSLNFNDFKKGNMPVEQQKECAILLPEIAKYVKCIDVNFKDGFTARLEGLINALESVQTADFSAVMIDFMQNISKSTQHDKKYNILDTFKVYLQRYIKTSNVPVVLFAQLHSIGKRANVALDSRVKDYPAILEAATVVLELIPNFEDKTTDVLISKDRFGCAGKKITCGFDKGRLVEYDETFKSKVTRSKVDELLEEVNVCGVKDNEGD
jgi:hypothetical protein